MKRLALILSLLVSCSIFGREPVWVIAHMANSVAAVKWAAGAGANGIEADLHFDAQGNPTVFQHGKPCDCTCLIDGVCKVVTCDAQVTAAEWFAAVVDTPSLGLVVIDSKVLASTNFVAGTKLIEALESELFAKGYKGMVIIGSPKLDTYPYLHAAATAAVASKYGNRLYFTIDGEGSHASDVLNKLAYTLPSPNIVYGTGVSACAPASYKDAIRLGEKNRRASVIGFVYIWTIDSTKAASNYLEEGAGGIMTNEPHAIFAMVEKSQRYLMAKPGTFFPAATSKRVVTR